MSKPEDGARRDEILKRMLQTPPQPKAGQGKLKERRPGKRAEPPLLSKRPSERSD